MTLVPNCVLRLLTVFTMLSISSCRLEKPKHCRLMPRAPVPCIEARLSESGYTVFPSLMATHDHGIPLNRRRLYNLAFHCDRSPGSFTPPLRIGAMPVSQVVKMEGTGERQRKTKRAKPD